MYLYAYTYVYMYMCMYTQIRPNVFCYIVSDDISTDPSLTPSNFMLALDSLPDEKWEVFGLLLDVPSSTLDKIGSEFHSDQERKAAVCRVYLIEHPQPTWEHVSDAIYKLSGGQYHRVLERLQSMFPTGEHLM